MQEILTSFRDGLISQAEAEEQINALLKPNPRKRGRPKKEKAPPKKNGRPRKLSTFERNLEIMQDLVALEISNIPISGNEKKKLLSVRYRVSEKTIETCITELNKRAENGEVAICDITHTVIFMSEQDKMTAFFDLILGREPAAQLRPIKSGTYAKS